MEVTFQRKDFKADCHSIAEILYEEKAGRVQKYIASCLNLDMAYLYELDKAKGINYIADILEDEYTITEDLIGEKLQTIQKKWHCVEEDVFKHLENIFDYKLDEARRITAEFSLNVVCPRYLDLWSFEINFRKNDEAIILVCIHEIIHFIWFEKWLTIFPDSNQREYNAPFLPWLFSEIAIDAILKESELKKYCTIAKPAYQYFYELTIDGENMMDYFKALFRENSIEDFMKKGILYIQQNKDKLMD